MILWIPIVLVLAFCAGCLVGQASTVGGFRALGRRGWRAWYLGRLYPLPPSAEEIHVARAAERRARDGKFPPTRDSRLS